MPPTFAIVLRCPPRGVALLHGRDAEAAHDAATQYSPATICALPLLAGPPGTASISEATLGLYAKAVLRRSGSVQTAGGVGALAVTAMYGASLHYILTRTKRVKLVVLSVFRTGYARRALVPERRTAGSPGLSERAANPS